MIQVQISYPASTVVHDPFWRVKHDIEIGKLWRNGLPEVHPLFANHHSPFQRWSQEASFGLNPWFTPDRWKDIYHYRYWIANNQGFGIPDDPRANFILHKDENAKLPRVEALVCGGSMISGKRNGDWVKVNGMHFNSPVSLGYLKLHPEFWVRGIFAGGTGQVFRMLGDKYEGPALIHPLIINGSYECNIQASKLQEWTQVEPPDPLKIYL